MTITNNNNETSTAVTSSSNGSTKGNSGASAQKRQQKRLLAVFGFGLLVAYVAIITFNEAHFDGVMVVPDVVVDRRTGKARMRRGKRRRRQRDEETTDLDAILKAELTLVDVQAPASGLAGSPHQKYTAWATFCAIDWDLQQKGNPSVIPMFRDLRAQSTACEDTLTTVDLYDIVAQAKEYDAKVAGTPDAIYVVDKPNGVVFHETRCGSTLAANLMASIQSTRTSRVFSESPPPVNAFRACERGNHCNSQTHMQLIRDVVYLMGRSQQPLDYLFFKIQSIGVMTIDKFTQAFPDVPWVFVYRDSVEIMQSHIKNEQRIEAGGQTPVCGRYKGAPTQPATTALLLKQHNIASSRKMSVVEYCAAHLGALSLSAIQENKRTGKGRFVNYKNLPDVMWTSVVPESFGIPLEAADISKMQQRSGVYSKGRGQRANTEWRDDSTKKQTTASQSVIDATHKFMDDIYNQMEELARENAE